MKTFKRAFLAAFLFLSILPGTQMGFAEDIQLQVIVQKANVRAKPDLESEIVTQVSLGTVLTSDLKEGNWFRILLPPDENGVRREAFIHNSIVEVISTTKEPAQKAEVNIKKEDEKIPSPPKKDIAEKYVMQPLESVQEGSSWTLKFGIKLLGGGSFLYGRNDFNEYFRALNEYDSESTALEGNIETVTGEYKPLKTSLGGGIEFFIDLFPHLGVSLGIGNIMGAKEGTVYWTSDFYGYEEDISLKQKISAIPLILSFNFNVPLGNSLMIGIYTGAGIYFGKVTYEATWDYSETATDFYYRYEDTWSAKTTSLGFHGGLELEYLFTETMALVLRAGGNLVTFSGLTGDYVSVYEDSSGANDTDTNKNETMWFGEWKRNVTNKWYPDVWIREIRPEDDEDERNYEEGRVSLTGFGIQIGIKVRFGK